MSYKVLIVPALVGILSFSANSMAADEEAMTQQTPQMSQGVTHGSRLMTPQERSEHRAKMRAAKNPKERKEIREAQHKRMKERAKQQGLTLPEKPPMVGGGMGPGGGGGMMMGPASGGTMAPSEESMTPAEEGK
jgi:hypothetical protein